MKTKRIDHTLTKEEIRKEGFHIDPWLQERGFNPTYPVKKWKRPDRDWDYYQDVPVQEH